jgi:tetratricopeptide (TPR) repeat protein
MRELSWALCSQGLYKESENVARYAMERFEGPLGPEHVFILETRSQLGTSLAEQGRYRESEDIFRAVLKQQSKLLGESHPSTLITAWRLAESLYAMDHIEEATIWYEKTLWGEVDVYGPDGSYTIASCGALRNCYEMQGRYDDAMELCQQLVERIQAVKGNDDPAIAKLQGWIEGTQNLLLEEEEDMSGEVTDYLSEEGDEGVREGTEEDQ